MNGRTILEDTSRMKCDGSELRRVFHLTLFKCGSQWVRDVLRAKEVVDCGMPAYSGITVDGRRGGFPDVSVPSFSGPLYAVDRGVWRMNARAGDRAVVVVRDPRDRIVSEIFSDLYSHGSGPRVNAERDFMNRLVTLEDRIRYKILKAAPDVRFCLSWIGCEDTDVRVLRYEELLEDQQARFADVFAWLGISVPDEELAVVVDRLSFERRSGRTRGEQDLLSHYRRGVAGDWRNHFTRELGELWESLYPGALREVGYEADDDWWKDLPESDGVVANDLPDEVMVVRERNRVLERESVEKEAEIARLDTAARERLDWNKRLDADLRTLQAELAEKEAEIARLDTAARERLELIERLNAEISIMQAELESQTKESRADSDYASHAPPRADIAPHRAAGSDEGFAPSDHLAQLEEKELVIQELARALREQRRFTTALLGLRYPLRIFNYLTAGLRPRLGRLWHHSPRTMRILPPYESVHDDADLPSISIVTPSYNQGRYIERTLRSVLDQNYPKLEFRVQDGGSSDETPEILSEYTDRLAGWASEPDSGQAEAINRAFSMTSGEVMGWLNSDDLLLPGVLHRVAAFFLLHPEVDVVYGDRLLIDEDDFEIGCWVLPDHDDGVLSWVDFVPQETLFWRREIWERVGGALDENFRFALDWDLLVRFRAAGARFAHLDAFLGAFRIHEHQKTSAAIEEVGYREMDKIRLRCLGRVPTQWEVRRALAPYLVRHLVRHYVRPLGRN